ncbi:MAG TPA: CRISPR-associated endonuclease Cas1 [Methanoregulaceae archaeon]|nr:CRISPR-associated endonuclease Cas1 [Methanoregulaceae archaeon]
MKIPWLIIPGFGAHIKATPRMVIIQRNGRTEEYPISSVRHLLVMGGHFIHSSAVINLVKSGAYVSFFEADGEPVGFVRPFGDHMQDDVQNAQKRSFSHSFALQVAKSSISSRILFVEQLQEQTDMKILYEGELEILQKGLSELEYLVRIDEIRRIHRLLTDMYYEIISRLLPGELNFRRRTERPHTDVVNAMLSIGYGMLFGNACVAAVGAHLDPDIGFLHKGKGALVHDILDPFRPGMVDREVLALAATEVCPDDYECTGSRCILSNNLMKRLSQKLQGTIDQGILDAQMMILRDSLLSGSEFYFVRQQENS